jgi:MFS family permease
LKPRQQALPHPRTGGLQQGRWYAWFFWGIVAVFFLYEFYIRVTPNVILPELAGDFDSNPGAIGSAMSIYLWVYAPAQLLVGWLFDRFGTKYLVSSAAIVCGIGAILFSTAQVLEVAALSRGLIGLGSAFAFVGAIYIATVWFPPARLALIAGITSSVGMIGEVIGQYPMERFVEMYSWRTVVLSTGFIGIGLGVIMVLVIPKRPSWLNALVSPHESDSIGFWSSLGRVLSNGQMWIIGFVSAVVYLPLSVLAALWGTSSLETLHDLTAEQASIAISMVPIGWLVGCPILALLSDRLKLRVPFLLLGCIGGGATTAMLLFPHLMSFFWLNMLMLATGVFISTQAVTFAMAMEINPRRFRATSVAICNFIVMLIAACLQVGIGWILNWRAQQATPQGQPHASQTGTGWQPTDWLEALTVGDYQVALATIPILFAIAIVACFFIRETHGRNLVDPAPDVN